MIKKFAIIIAFGLFFSVVYFIDWYIDSYHKEMAEAINCRFPISTAQDAIEFGKEYTTREPDFIKNTNAHSAEQLRAMLSNDKTCCSAEVNIYYSGRPAIWTIAIVDRSKKDLTLMVLEVTSCRRKLEAHW